MMTQHTLKITTMFFDAVKNGIKTFEIRPTDDYALGDTLHLREYDPNLKTDTDMGYTGRTVDVCVTYVLTSMDFPTGIPTGYCIMGIRLI